MVPHNRSNLPEKARDAIFQRIENGLHLINEYPGDDGYKAVVDGISALGIIGRIERQIAAKRQEKFVGNGRCSEFNVYIDGDDASRGTRLDGVEKVILPTVTVNGFGYIERMNLQLVFRSQEDAAAILKTPGEPRRIEVRAAITALDNTTGGGYAFHGYRYILEAAPVEIAPEPLERMSGTGVKIRFLVKRYIVNVVGGRTAGSWRHGSARRLKADRRRKIGGCGRWMRSRPQSPVSRRRPKCP